MLTILPPALAALGEYRQFCLYFSRPGKNGKIDKIPCNALGAPHDAHDAANWMTGAEAERVAAMHGGRLGLAFVFTAEDPFFFLDLDGVHDGANWSVFAQTMCQAFAGCAIEVSISGRGLHIIGKGHAGLHSCQPPGFPGGLYTEKRFIALTGTHVVGDAGHAARPEVLNWLVEHYFPAKPKRGTLGIEWTEGPCTEWRGPTDDDDLIRRALKSQSARSALTGGASFADLWTANGDVLAGAYPADANGSGEYNASAADAALAAHLAFWTGRDCARIERLMWRSSLVREKWERGDYLEPTILGACAVSRDVLQDKALATPSVVVDEEAPYSPPESREVLEATYVDVPSQVEMFRDCVYIRGLHRVLTPSGELLRPDAFRVAYGGFMFVLDRQNQRHTNDAWEAFTASQCVRHRQAADTCFRPDLPHGAFVRRDGLELVNLYKPLKIKRIAGDPAPFLRHLSILLPDERDRTILLSYFAACVQYRGRKFRWAPVIQGVEGNGKTLLSLFLAYAVGQKYVHWPKASKLGAQFNGWMYGKLLYCVEDMYLPKGNLDIVEELKPMITGENLEIEGKGVDQTTREICGNFVLNCNSKSAVKKTRNDRRYANFFCAQQAESDLRRDGLDSEYMTDVNDWARGLGAHAGLGENYGFAVVAEFLTTWAIPPEFNPATHCQRAPVTSSTEEAIAASHSPVEQHIMEAVEEGRPGFRGGWLSSNKVRDLLVEIGMRMAPAQREALILGLRYVRHPGLPGGRPNNPVLPDGGRPVLYVRATHLSLSLTAAPQIAAAYEQAQREI